MSGMARVLRGVRVAQTWGLWAPTTSPPLRPTPGRCAVRRKMQALTVTSSAPTGGWARGGGAQAGARREAGAAGAGAESASDGWIVETLHEVQDRTRSPHRAPPW